MARLLGRIFRHDSSGLSPLEPQRPGHRLTGIVILYLTLIAGIVGYNAREMAHERGAALIVNVAARQRALAERYVKDALLQAEGVPADPRDDARQLLTNADALLLGGDVIAVQGADSMVHIRPASENPRVGTTTRTGPVASLRRSAISAPSSVSSSTESRTRVATGLWKYVLRSR